MTTKIRVLLAFLSLGTACLGQAINLALFQHALASSSDGGTIPGEAVDGIVSNDSRWYSASDGEPQWLEIQLKESFTLGSAQLYLGKDDSFSISNFTIQYANGAGWNTISTISGNTSTDLNLVFPAPVVANRFRIHVNSGVMRVKELALFAPNGGSGYPLGTDVTLNLANRRPPTASSVYQSNYAWKAIDGHVDDNSRWLCENSGGPHTYQVELASIHEVGSIHLYSGSGSGSPLANFDIEYANGSGWTAIPGGTVSSGSISGKRVSGNTSQELIVNFSAPVSANKIRLSFAQPYGRIRELMVMPANVTNTGTPGYPIGAGVRIEARPWQKFKDYHDAWYRLARRGNDSSLLPGESGSTHATAETPQEDKNLQFLYLPAENAYRIRQQSSGKCLEVQGASQSAGALIVLGDYSAAPHQLWKLRATSDGYFQVQNVWSEMVIASDGGNPASISQQPYVSSSVPETQEWQPKHQSDYFKKGTGGWVGSFNTGWAYDWARNNDNLGTDQYYTPMQHREGWPNLGSLHKKQHSWNRKNKTSILLGFNEPDRPDQADMSVNKGIELWPRLMALNVPLVSPACALGGESWWLDDFMDRVDNKGYRCEYTGGHWYSGPSSDNFMNYVDSLQGYGNGRPVWITEFSVVDWSGGSGSWSEESNYNFILEVMWRAEAKSNLRKYAIFIFSGGVPENPWTMSNPRSNFRTGGGSLHAFGKAYAAWDGDKTIRMEQPYLIHNRNARHRMRNTGSGAPEPSWIRREDDSVQWILRDAGGGNTHIISVVDGTMLRYDGSLIDHAPPGTTGPDVEWDFQKEQYGWHNIIHPDTGKYLRLYRENDSNNGPTLQEFQMVTASAASGYSSTDWWFVKPHSQAAVAPPAAPINLVATPGDSRVGLTWNTVADAGLGYSVFRTSGGSSSSLIQSSIMTTAFTDHTVSNGTAYTYTVTATNLLGLESAPSNGATSTPNPPDPNSDYTLWATSHSLSGPNSGFDDDWDGDGLDNGIEFAFLTNPKESTTSPLRISRESDGTISIEFPWNAAADNDWDIASSTNLQNPWNPHDLGMVEIEDSSPLKSIRVEPVPSSEPALFYKLVVSP